MILDDYSRFILGWSLLEKTSIAEAIQTVGRAVHRYKKGGGMKVRHRYKISYWLSILLILSLTFSGCSVLLLPDYEVAPIEKYPNSKTINGLTVAIYILSDPEESKKYFGVDFNKTELLPILILVNNRSLDASYIISKENIFLYSGQTYQNQQKNDIETASNMETSGTTTSEAASAAVGAGILFFTPLALVALPVFVSGANKICNAQEIKRNMLENEFQTTTVSRGKSTHGFIYFQRPNGKKQNDKLFLRIDTDNLKRKSAEQFVFEISL